MMGSISIKKNPSIAISMKAIDAYSVCEGDILVTPHAFHMTSEHVRTIRLCTALTHVGWLDDAKNMGIFSNQGAQVACKCFSKSVTWSNLMLDESRKTMT